MKKRKKLKKAKKVKEKDPTELFQDLFQSKANELDRAFALAVVNIPKLFCQYSIREIASSLFVSSIWLPNISSMMKHQLLAAIFASIKPEEFSNSQSINTYSEFSQFWEKLQAVLPTFFMMEDYVPETDWGDVKFYHDRRNYKIFYGQELCNVNEYLTLFQMLYLPYKKEYLKFAGRSASRELQYCLRLQDEIISGISVQPNQKDLSEISPGHIEVPPSAFWMEAVKFYKNFDIRDNFDEKFLTDYSIELGALSKEYMDCGKFQEMVHIVRIPTQVATRFRFIAPPHSGGSRHLIPIHSATPFKGKKGRWINDEKAAKAP